MHLWVVTINVSIRNKTVLGDKVEWKKHKSEKKAIWFVYIVDPEQVWYLFIIYKYVQEEREIE
jgi:hypothetical protein